MDRPALSRPSSSRSSSPRASRPQQSPVGPRVRSVSAMMSLDRAAQDIQQPRLSTISTNTTLYSPGPSSPSRTQSVLYKVDSPIAEADSDPSPVSPSRSLPFPHSPPPFSHSSTPLSHSPPPFSPGPESSNFRSALTTADPSPRVQRVSPTSSLIPPPATKFESKTVRWKGLPLEAALWTFTSKQLQDVVSRAIRSSARESFVRMLSIDQLDSEIPAEIEQLKSLKATKQSQYRFNVQRRSMLLQALNSYSGIISSSPDDGGELIFKLALQISDITNECDKLAQELLCISDQLAQLGKLIDTHWASALAIALRKLNTSYGKRTGDLIKAKERISTLEAELEDAWKEAAKMAKEIDEINNAHGSDSDEIEEEDTAIIGTAEVVSIHTVSMASPTRPLSTPTILSFPSRSPPSTLFNRLQLTPPHTTKPMPSPDDVPSPVGEHDNDDISEHISIRTAKSRRSHKSTKSVGEASRVSVVEAARRRSLRTSLGSLRIPTRRATSVRAPPVPVIPKTLSPVATSPVSYLSSSRDGSAISDSPVSAASRQRASIRELNLMVVPRHLSGYAPGTRPHSAVDDIIIMPRTTMSSEDEIQTVPRLMHRSVDDVSLTGGWRNEMSYPPSQPAQTIPSIWLMSDVPRTPAERVESMMKDKEQNKATSYRRLKTFTKRYSNPFPGLMARSLSSLRSSGRNVSG